MTDRGDGIDSTEVLHSRKVVHGPNNILSLQFGYEETKQDNDNNQFETCATVRHFAERQSSFKEIEEM